MIVRLATMRSVFMLTISVVGMLSQVALADDQRSAIDAAFAAVDDDTPTRLEAVIQRNALSVDVSEPDGNTLLMESARRGKTEIVEWLISHGANVNARREGTTALMLAANHGKTDAVKSLVAGNALLDLRNKDGCTALFLASPRRPAIVKMLLEAGARPDIHGPDGRTPLMQAAVYRNHEIIGQLLQHGAAIDRVNDDGKSALMFSVDINLIQTHYGPIEPTLKCVLPILEAKPTLNLRSNKGETALTLARHTLKYIREKHDLIQIIRVLRELGAR